MYKLKEVGPFLEEWRDVKGYEGYYQISSYGRLKSLDRVVPHKRYGRQRIKGFIMSPTVSKRGYLALNLCREGVQKKCKIHKMVVSSFLDHDTSDFEIVIDHIDSNKINNNISNLRLVTMRDNASKDKKNKSSKYRGVDFHRQRKKWRVRILIGNDHLHLGIFSDEKKASDYYETALIIIDKYIGDRIGFVALIKEELNKS